VNSAAHGQRTQLIGMAKKILVAKKADPTPIFPPRRPRSTSLSIPFTALPAKKSPLSKRACNKEQLAGKLLTRQRLRSKIDNKGHPTTGNKSDLTYGKTI